jgi:signal transduction histidine kinase
VRRVGDIAIDGDVDLVDVRDTSAQTLDALEAAAGEQPAPAGAGAEMLAAATLVSMALEPGGDTEALAAFAARAAGQPGVDRLRIALLALADPKPLSATLDEALAAHSRLLAALGGLCSVSVWHLGPGLRPRVAAASGPVPAAVSSGVIARIAAGGLDREPAVLIRAFDEPCALLTWIDAGVDGLHSQLIAARSALLLGVAFERAQALDRAGLHTRGSAERRLTRVALDLHDGPLQDIALLRGELSALRRSLASTQKRTPADRLAMVDDLQAIAEAAEADLRELAVSLESTRLMRRPLADALRGLARAFALRSGIEPSLIIEGRGEDLTAAERGVLLRVVGEALANTRAHADASEVSIELRIGAHTVEANITDDGRGFDVERRIPESVRDGSLGVIGMVERVRQLGGSCRVASVPGTGTSVILSFARSEARAAQLTGRAAV